MQYIHFKTLSCASPLIVMTGQKGRGVRALSTNLCSGSRCIIVTFFLVAFGSHFDDGVALFRGSTADLLRKDIENETCKACLILLANRRWLDIYKLLSKIKKKIELGKRLNCKNQIMCTLNIRKDIDRIIWAPDSIIGTWTEEVPVQHWHFCTWHS